MDDHTIVPPAQIEHPLPCGDCGRQHLNGDHVKVFSTLQETVWEGCVWCWVKRSAPQQEPK